MKTLTEELIQERLENKGVTVPHETSQDDKISKLKELYEFDILNDWQTCDVYFYTDETSDGYEIWIATENERNVHINEDVYYYETSWFEKLADYIRDGASIYIDQYAQEGYEYEEVIEAIYEEWYMEEHDAIVDELGDEGYKYPESE